MHRTLPASTKISLFIVTSAVVIYFIQTGISAQTNISYDTSVQMFQRISSTKVDSIMAKLHQRRDVLTNIYLRLNDRVELLKNTNKEFEYSTVEEKLKAANSLLLTAEEQINLMSQPNYTDLVSTRVSLTKTSFEIRQVIDTLQQAKRLLSEVMIDLKGL